MSIYETAQLIAATAVLLLALFSGNLRAAGWIVAISLDLLFSTWWWTSGYPLGDVVTASTDFALCMLIWFLARHRWEFWLFLLYQCSMLVSIIDLAALIWAPGWIEHDTYSTVLEAINYSSFILIGGVSGFIINERTDIVALRPWRRVLSLDSLILGTREKDRD